MNANTNIVSNTATATKTWTAIVGQSKSISTPKIIFGIPKPKLDTKTMSIVRTYVKVEPKTHIVRHIVDPVPFLIPRASSPTKVAPIVPKIPKKTYTNTVASRTVDGVVYSRTGRVKKFTILAKTVHINERTKNVMSKFDCSLYNHFHQAFITGPSRSTVEKFRRRVSEYEQDIALMPFAKAFAIISARIKNLKPYQIQANAGQCLFTVLLTRRVKHVPAPRYNRKTLEGAPAAIKYKLQGPLDIVKKISKTAAHYVAAPYNWLVQKAGVYAVKFGTNLIWDTWSRIIQFLKEKYNTVYEAIKAYLPSQETVVNTSIFVLLIVLGVLLAKFAIGFTFKDIFIAILIGASVGLSTKAISKMYEFISSLVYGYEIPNPYPPGSTAYVAFDRHINGKPVDWLPGNGDVTNVAALHWMVSNGHKAARYIEISPGVYELNPTGKFPHGATVYNCKTHTMVGTTTKAQGPETDDKISSMFAGFHIPIVSNMIKTLKSWFGNFNITSIGFISITSAYLAARNANTIFTLIEKVTKFSSVILKYVHTWIYGYPPGDQPRYQFNSMYSTVINQYIPLKPRLLDPAWYKDKDLVDKIHSLWRQITVLSRPERLKDLDPNLRSSWNIMSMELEKLAVVADSVIRTGLTRKPPTGVMFFGRPECGKTTAMEYLSKGFVSKVLMDGRDKQTAFNADIWNRPKTLFWDGYVGQRVIIYEELAAASEASENLEMFSEILTLCSNGEFIPNKAKVEEKGNVRAAPRLVLSASMALQPKSDNDNAISLAAINSGLVDDFAVFRRFLCYEVTRDPTISGPLAFKFIPYKFTEDKKQIIRAGDAISFAQLLGITIKIDRDLQSQATASEFDYDSLDVDSVEVPTHTTFFNSRRPVPIVSVVPDPRELLEPVQEEIIKIEDLDDDLIVHRSSESSQVYEDEVVSYTEESLLAEPQGGAERPKFEHPFYEQVRKCPCVVPNPFSFNARKYFFEKFMDLGKLHAAEIMLQPTITNEDFIELSKVLEVYFYDLWLIGFQAWNAAEPQGGRAHSYMFWIPVSLTVREYIRKIGDQTNNWRLYLLGFYPKVNADQAKYIDDMIKEYEEFMEHALDDSDPEPEPVSSDDDHTPHLWTLEHDDPLDTASDDSGEVHEFSNPYAPDDWHIYTSDEDSDASAQGPKFFETRAQYMTREFKDSLVIMSYDGTNYSFKVFPTPGGIIYGEGITGKEMAYLSASKFWDYMPPPTVLFGITAAVAYLAFKDMLKPKVEKSLEESFPSAFEKYKAFLQSEVYDPTIVTRVPMMPGDKIYKSIFKVDQKATTQGPGMDIMHKISKNLFAAHIGPTRYGHMLVTGDNGVNLWITNNHVLTLLKQYSEFQLIGIDNKYTVPTHGLDPMPLYDDLCVVTIPSIDKHKAFADIRSHFCNGSDTDFPSDVFCISISNSRKIDLSQIANVRFGIPTVDILPNVSYSLNGKFQHETRAGMCGSIWFSCGKRPGIIGMHFAGSGHTGWSAPLHVSAQAGEEDTYMVVDHGNPGVHIPSKTNLARSPLTTFPVEKFPAKMAKYTDADGTSRSPLREAMSGWFHGPEWRSRATRILTNRDYSAVINKKYGELWVNYTPETPFISLDKALNGFERDGINVLSKLDVSKSAGYPFNTTGRSKKKHWLDVDEKGYIRMTDRLWKHFEDYTVSPPYCTFLKDELRKPGKKTRLVQAESLVRTILLRSILGTLIAALYENRPAPVAVGIVPTSKDWEELWNLIQAADKASDGDAVAMDTTNGAEVQMAYSSLKFFWESHFQSLNKELPPLVFGYMSKEHGAQVKKWTWDEAWAIVLEPIQVLVNDELYIILHNPSGCTDTALRNAFALEYLYVNWWRELYPDLPWKTRVILYLIHLCLVMYGDDHILMLNKLKELVEIVKVAPDFSKITPTAADIGFQITAADKLGPVKEMSPSEITFLKRAFRPYTVDNQTIVLAPLDLLSITQNVLWYKSDRSWLEYAQPHFDAFEEEMIQHPELYRSHVAKLKIDMYENGATIRPRNADISNNLARRIGVSL